MQILALSGAIASGKNFIADILAQKLDCQVFDADKEVHDIYQNDQKIILQIKSHFDKVYEDGKINRQELSKIIFDNPKKLKVLEDIIHPQIRKNYQEFLKKSKANNAKFVILNIPLLLEKGGYVYDKLISITIYPSVQKKRFIARAKKKGQRDMEFLSKKFREIQERQLHNQDRKKDADFIVNTSFSKKQTKDQIDHVLAVLTG